jgi:hypothetical protein
MNEMIFLALTQGAEHLRDECYGLEDALQYTQDMADDLNADLHLGYARDSDSYGVLYKACEDAIRTAHGR